MIFFALWRQDFPGLSAARLFAQTNPDTVPYFRDESKELTFATRKDWFGIVLLKGVAKVAYRRNRD
jgi:hypothetical protein